MSRRAERGLHIYHTPASVSRLRTVGRTQRTYRTRAGRYLGCTLHRDSPRYIAPVPPIKQCGTSGSPHDKHPSRLIWGFAGNRFVCFIGWQWKGRGGGIGKARPYRVIVVLEWLE